MLAVPSIRWTIPLATDNPRSNSKLGFASTNPSTQLPLLVPTAIIVLERGGNVICSSRIASEADNAGLGSCTMALSGERLMVCACRLMTALFSERKSTPRMTSREHCSRTMKTVGYVCPLTATRAYIFLLVLLRDRLLFVSVGRPKR